MLTYANHLAIWIKINMYYQQYDYRNHLQTKNNVNLYFTNV